MAFHDLHFRMPKDMVGGKVPLSRLSSDKSPTPSIADIAASSDSRPISRTVSPFFRPRLNANPLDKPSASRTVSAPSKVVSTVGAAGTVLLLLWLVLLRFVRINPIESFREPLYENALMSASEWHCLCLNQDTCHQGVVK